MSNNWINWRFGFGAGDVEIRWVPVGTEFRITEYDGAESIEFKDNIAWEKA